MVLVDSNVLIDVLTDDPVWEKRSAGQLTRLGNTRQLAITPLIFAEIAMAYPDQTQLDAALPGTLVRLPLPYRAAFMAGRAFLQYRRRGDHAGRRFPTSTSAPMRLRRAMRSSPATLPGIAPTSRT